MENFSETITKIEKQKDLINRGNNLKEKDDHEEYKKRIRALVDRIEKGEDFAEIDKQPIDSKSDILEENHIYDTSFSSNSRIRTNIIKKLIKHHPDESLQLITEVFKQENSLYVFANIWRDLESAENEEYHILLDRFLSKFSKLVYNIDLNESNFCWIIVNKVYWIHIGETILVLKIFTCIQILVA